MRPTAATGVLVLWLAACGSEVADPTAPSASRTRETPTWSINALATPEFSSTGILPHDVGPRGHVVGQGRVNGRTHGILVDPSGTFVDLQPLAGDLVSFPTAVDGSGMAVGVSSTDPGYSAILPVIWSPGGRPEPLAGFTRSLNHSPSAIGKNGDIVGYTDQFDPTGATVHGFLLRRRATGPVDLGSPFPGMSSFAWAINDRGQIAGTADHPTQGTILVLWSPSAKMSVIGRPEELTPTFVSGIADNGLVLGSGFDQAFKQRAWTWRRGQGFRLLPVPEGYDGTSVTGFDRFGRAYGVAFVGPTLTDAILWTTAGPVILPRSNTGAVATAGVSRTGGLAGASLSAGVRSLFVWSLDGR